MTDGTMIDCAYYPIWTLYLKIYQNQIWQSMQWSSDDENPSKECLQKLKQLL